MSEFDPREFKGKIIFENCYWDTAAEILEDNDFVMRGNLRIGVIAGFSWMDSKIKRFYDVEWYKPNIQLQLRNQAERLVWQGKTDSQGRASFPIVFNDSNYNQHWKLSDNQGKVISVSFFSTSPIEGKR